MLSYSKDKLFIQMCNINFILCFIGYQLATTIFLPASSDIEGISQTVTIPYRALALLISFTVLYINRKGVFYLTNGVKLLLFYWYILFLRMIFDMFIRQDIYISPSQISIISLNAVGICFIAMLSVGSSFKLIDLSKSLKWIYLLENLVLVLSLLSNDSFLLGAEMSSRSGGNIALNTISFGHLGTTVLLLSIFIIIKKKLTKYQIPLVVLSMLLSFFMMMKAGSRGPLLAFVVVLLIWMYTKIKNKAFALCLLIAVASLVYLSFDLILGFIDNFNPVLKDRIVYAMEEGDTERNSLYREAIHGFLKNPITGSCFALVTQDGYAWYPHNIILEAFMGMGVIGGVTLLSIIFIAVKKSFHLISSNNENYWLALILLQQLMLNMTSGSFYENQLLSVLLLFIFLKFPNKTIEVKLNEVDKLKE